MGLCDTSILCSLETAVGFLGVYGKQAPLVLLFITSRSSRSPHFQAWLGAEVECTALCLLKWSQKRAETTGSSSAGTWAKLDWEELGRD